jgi:hypothetical protein
MLRTGGRRQLLKKDAACKGAYWESIIAVDVGETNGGTKRDVADDARRDRHVRSGGR